MGDRRWWQRTTEEIYVYRTRKPWAVWGLPVVGRHFAYGGRTNNPARRDMEHLRGGGPYHAVAKPWADLLPRRYVVFRRKRRTELTTHLLEVLTIRLFMCVYNVQFNTGNPRRIKPHDALRQRRLRDSSGRWARLAAMGGRYAGWALFAVLTVGAGIAYTWIN